MAEACLRFTTVREFGGKHAGDTVYVRGGNMRREYREGAIIENRDRHYMCQLDLEARVHTAARTNALGAKQRGRVYIDPAAWLQMHPPRPGRAYLTFATNRASDAVEFTDVGASETGFRHTTAHREEVTEFSEDDLDPALFVPPAHFARVPQLPGLFGYRYPLGMRLRLRWEMLKDKLLS